MSKKSLEENIFNQFLAIDLCIEKNLLPPSLILIYSGIDALASLNLPKERERVKGIDYDKFCNDYLLPDSDLKCSAIDLYAAKCSILHKSTAVSDLSEQEKTPELFYHIGDISDIQEDYQKIIDEKHNRNAIIVNIDDLRKAFNKSYFSFTKELEENLEKRERVYERAKNYFLIVRQYSPNNLG